MQLTQFLLQILDVLAIVATAIIAFFIGRGPLPGRTRPLRILSFGVTLLLFGYAVVLYRQSGRGPLEHLSCLYSDPNSDVCPEPESWYALTLHSVGAPPQRFSDARRDSAAVSQDSDRISKQERTAEEYAQSGEGFFVAGDFVRARRDTKESLNIFPLSKAYLTLAKMDYTVKAYATVIVDADDALLLDPTLEPALEIRAAAYDATQSPELALQDLNAAASLTPKKASVFCLRAFLENELGNQPSALSDYSLCLIMNPANGEGLKERGELYLALSHFQPAADDFSKAMRLNSRDWKLYDDRGRAYIGLRDFRAAMADFSRGMQLAPNQVGLYEQSAHIYFALFNNNHPLGKAEIDSLKSVVEVAANLGSKDHIIYYFLGLYGDDTSLNRADTISAFSKSIRIKPDFWPAYFERAKVSCDEAGSMELLPMKYTTRSEIDSAHKAAEAYYTSGISDFDKIIAHDPTNADAYDERGQCRLNAGDANGKTDIAHAKVLAPAKYNAEEPPFEALYEWCRRKRACRAKLDKHVEGSAPVDMNKTNNDTSEAGSNPLH
jgi:tetratricopeptide (TPR) repeat protein